MMSLAAIKQMNDEQARKAKRRSEEPFLFSKQEILMLRMGAHAPLRSLPHIGGFLPVGWSRVKVAEIDSNPHGIYTGDNKDFGAYFVDASGFGSPGEPALSVEEFVKRIKPGYGYAIVSAGQFQVKIGVFQCV